MPTIVGSIIAIVAIVALVIGCVIPGAASAAAETAQTDPAVPRRRRADIPGRRADIDSVLLE